MNDRAVVVLEQYDFEVSGTGKGRGSIIVETDKGIVTLSEYSGCTERLELCKRVCDRIDETGLFNTDNLIPNKEGLLYVTDTDGKNYVVKKHAEGRECNVTDKKECGQVVKGIAKLHKIMRFGKVSETEQSVTVRDFSKREAELLRVRTFMRKQAKKGDFELAFLKQYGYFEAVAKEAADLLDKACLKQLSAYVSETGMYCHGECNQHNVLINKEREIAVTHFEKCCMDLQVRDLYLFLRKILEKNHWSYDVGAYILDAYRRENGLNPDECRYLYARLLYPERFWKIANAYLNKRKSLPPRRQSEKLQALLDVEKARMVFLERLSKDLL